jgi:REP element-mobilizing transposase RayT
LIKANVLYFRITISLNSSSILIKLLNHTSGAKKMQSMVQLGAPKCGHGGARKGAGRKRKVDSAKAPHVKREQFTGRLPVQVTLKMRPDVVNLRRDDVFEKVEAALRTGAARDDGKVCDFTVLGDHLHFIVDSVSNKALRCVASSVAIRIAKQINKLTGRQGRVFKDRYHARVLRSPSEVRNSRSYILNNFRKHLAQRLATERTQPQAAHICVTPKHLDIARQILAMPDWIDPYSSAGLRRKGIAWPTGSSWLLSEQAAALAERFAARRRRAVRDQNDVDADAAMNGQVRHAVAPVWHAELHASIVEV